MRRPDIYQANCEVCRYAGPERLLIDQAMTDQERHANTARHKQSIRERDQPERTADEMVAAIEAAGEAS